MSAEHAHSDISRNKIWGSITGAFIGDAIGSFLEFKEEISQSELRLALTMPGGSQGTHGTGPGQVTDDSELALCLMKGLIEGRGSLNLDRIAHYYQEWIKNDPFDVGNTTGTAFEPLRRSQNAYAYMPIRCAAHYNQHSLSNGGLMRCTPLAVWCHKLPDDDLIRAVGLEVSMTHSNIIAQQIEACYIKAITHLINNPGDNQGAYLAAKNMSRERFCAEVNKWFEDIENKPPMPGSPSIGYVKIAFDHAFRALRSRIDYVTAISDVLMIGGDTDTNACIVGGMVGAYHGFDAIPQEWKDKIINYHYSTHGGRRRPEFLDQRELNQLISQLVEVAPSTLNVEMTEMPPLKRLNENQIE